MEGEICIRALADIGQINGCKSKIREKDEYITKLSKILWLAGNDVRLKILYLFSEEKELCVCDLSDILKMNVSAISQHLRKLKDGDLVDVRKDGQTYYYFIKEGNMQVLETFFNIINSKNATLKAEII